MEDPDESRILEGWRAFLRLDVLASSMLAAGFLLRLTLAYFASLNPDEALHYLLSQQSSAHEAYRASLNTVHPPLLIMLLYYWGHLGRSELFLRLPSVLAGTGFCWVIYRWLLWAVDRSTALIAFSLLLFLPPFVFLSSEIRQYALMFLFLSLTILLFDWGLARASVGMMTGSALALYLALLTHYSALMVALAFGIYALARILSQNAITWKVVAVWVVGQVGALVLTGVLFATHIAQLDARGAPKALADGMVVGSMFHPGQDNILWFILKANIRLFRYLFWSGAIGGLALLIFAVGLTMLLRSKYLQADPEKPSYRQLGVLVALPFLINLIAAFARKYPYGNTRHNSFLIIFAVTAISIALSRWSASRKWPVTFGIVGALLVSTIFPNPSGAYIPPKYQKRELMHQATDFLARSVPDGSTILTDEESGLLLSRYFCHEPVVQLDFPKAPLRRFPCRSLNVISSSRFIFDDNALQNTLLQIGKMDSFPNETVWFFQAGWNVGQFNVTVPLARYGCSAPTMFGPNILVCRLTLSEITKN
jgi:uncharacterized membrane protein